MYEPHRPYPFAALLVLCLALCADSALAGATGGWEDGASPAVPDTGFAYGKKCFVSAEFACKFYALERSSVYVSHSPLSNGMQLCKFSANADGQLWHGAVASCKKPEKGFDPDPTKPEPPESGGGGDFGGGGASDSWEEDPKKPDEDKKDPEDPKDPDPDFGDLGDIPKPPVPPTPPASGPNVNVGVGVNVPEPCTGAAAGTVGCMKPGEPTGEKPKTKDVKVPTQAEKPVSNIKGCPDPKYFYLWNERYEISYDQFCAQAPLIKPYVIFSATFAAFFITLSAFRRK